MPAYETKDHNYCSQKFFDILLVSGRGLPRNLYSMSQWWQLAQRYLYITGKLQLLIL